MDESFILFICFSNVDIVEISQMRLNHSFSNMNIDDNFLFSEGEKRVAILFIFIGEVGDHLVLLEFDFCVFGLEMDIYCCRLFCCDFDKDDALVAGLFWEAFGFGDKLFALLIGFDKFLHALFVVIALCAFSKGDKGESFVAGELDVVFLVGADLVEFGGCFVDWDSFEAVHV